MKIIKLITYLTLLFLFTSCNNQKTIIEPVLSVKSQFDLEAINFNENVSKLFSQHLQTEFGSEYDSLTYSKLPDSLLEYKIKTTVTDILKFKIPQKKLGYLYKSKPLDSVAKFGIINFSSLNILTDLEKKPIAYHAGEEYTKLEDRIKVLDAINKKYGKSKYAFNISNDYHQLSYEWVLADRTIQITTSFGWGVTISTDKPMTNGKYYKLDMLIISNKEKSNLNNAHIFETPDKILYNNKLYSYKDFQLEKKETYKDDFYLNSWDEKLIENKNGYYNIVTAEPED